MTIWQNKYVLSLLALLTGGLLTYLFLPTKIETHEVVKTVVQDKIIHQVKTVHKDGTVTVVTDTHDVSHETSHDESKKLTGYNPKKILVYGGTQILHGSNWIVGGSYNIYGPLDVGIVYRDGVYLTAGLRF